MPVQRVSRKRRYCGGAPLMALLALSRSLSACDATEYEEQMATTTISQPSGRIRGFHLRKQMHPVERFATIAAIFDDDRHERDPTEYDETDDGPLEYTRNPSEPPTNIPSQSPMIQTSRPTTAPSALPSTSHTNSPSQLPSDKDPTISPTKSPTIETPQPTVKQQPTKAPSPPISPTKSPTIETPQPTKAPSPPILPTKSPTIETPQPTKAPSPPILPTKSPTIETPQPTTAKQQPTNAPSPPISPTKSPTIETPQPTVKQQPTKAPSPPISQPTAPLTTMFPSFAPTSKISSPQSPSTQPAASPSLNTEAPSLQPTCFLDMKNGTIGEMNFTSASVLRYSYEIETDVIAEAILKDEVIPEVEIAILEYLYRSIPGCIVNSRRRTLLDSNFPRYLEEVMGMSISPRDVISVGGCKTVLNDLVNACEPIKGGMSVYLKDQTEDTKQDMISKIALGMLNGDFLHAHSAIKKITFIGSGDLIVPDPNSGTPTLQPTSENSNDSPIRINFLAAILGVAGASLIGGLVVARRRAGLRRSREITSSINLEEASGLSSHLSFEPELPSSPHDVETIKVGNRMAFDEMEVNVDLESLRSSDESDEYFDFFDLILEGSKPSLKEKDTGMEYSSDGVSDISFHEI